MKPLLTTQHLSYAWSQQHTISPPGEWARAYWDDWKAHHRDTIMEALKSVYPFESLLEFGCASGPNLRRVHAEWPGVYLTGVDVNDEALSALDIAAEGEGWGAETGLYLEAVRSPQDVALTCYTLTYLGPDAIDQTLQRLSELAQKALVIAEPSGRDGEEGVIPGGQKDVGYQEWIYDYPDRLKPLGWQLLGVHAVTPSKQRLQEVQVFTKT